MAWKNTSYRGPDIMISLMRGTNLHWQVNSMRNGVLISKYQYREKYPGDRVSTLKKLFEQPQRGIRMDPRVPGTFFELSDREQRNLHSERSDPTHDDTTDAPASKYCSLTSRFADTNWGQGAPPTIRFRFDIWRSDVWKGRHDLTRDPALFAQVMLRILVMPEAQRRQVLAEETPPDWDRGLEFEWLALGGTKIYNVHEWNNGAWVPSRATNPGWDFWWETL